MPQLSKKSVQILDGAVTLTKRDDSSFWQARYKVADLSYQKIIQECFADGDNQEKKLHIELKPFQRISDCTLAKKFEAFANNLIMQPKFKTKFSQ